MVGLNYYCSKGVFQLNHKSSMKRKMIIDISLICLFLSLIAFIYLYISSTHKKELENASASKDHLIIKETEDTFYKHAELSYKTDDLSYKIQYPKTSSKKLNTDIQKAINNMKQTYIDTHSKDSSLSIDYDVYKNEKTYSFVLSQKVKEGIVFTEKNFLNFTFDTENDVNLSLKDIIPTNKELKYAQLLINKKLQQQDASKKYFKEQHKELQIDTDSRHFNNFALDQQRIIFYFNTGDFTRPYNGTAKVIIERTELNQVLATATKKEQPIKKTTAIVAKKSNTASKKEQPIKKGTATAAKKTATKKQKVVALTFDDGPNTTSTVKILSILKKHNAKATFFIVGNQAKANPSIVKKIAAEQHELGNHTFAHPDLKNLSTKNIQLQISSTNKYIKAASGQNPTVFRPPYGSTNASINKIAQLPAVLWDVDTLDWQHRNPNKTFNNIKKNTRNHSIILMHDIHMTTADALDRSMTYLEKQGYSFVTVSQLRKIKAASSK